MESWLAEVYVFAVFSCLLFAIKSGIPFMDV